MGFCSKLRNLHLKVFWKSVFPPQSMEASGAERGSCLGWIILQTPLAIFAQKRFICLNRDVQCYFRPCECSLKPSTSIPQWCRFLRLPSYLPVLDGCIGGDRASQVAVGNYAVAAELSPAFLLITVGPTYCWLFDVCLHNSLVCISGMW